MKKGRPKDKSILIKVCVLNKDNSSINFSIRLKDNKTYKDAVKEIEEKFKYLGL